LIVLDTSIVSLAFRRRARPVPEPAAVVLFRHLILTGEPMFLPGICLQEFLSGARTPEQARRLAALAEGFEVRPATESDHRLGAEIETACRRVGVAMTTIDALIAGQTIRARGRLFTLDADFLRIPRPMGLRIVQLGQGKTPAL
jgi:predicted nucleic acid-binding protein